MFIRQESTVMTETGKEHNVSSINEIKHIYFHFHTLFLLSCEHFFLLFNLTTFSEYSPNIPANITIKCIGIKIQN